MKRIRTAYKEHPGSNVGKIVATASGKQATKRMDQALSSDANHEAAARALADRLNVELGECERTRGNDAGTIRYYKVKGS